MPTTNSTELNLLRESRPDVAGALRVVWNRPTSRSRRWFNDVKLSPQERSARVDEVIRRGTRLELQLKLGRPA